jgi:ribose transport system substrate-binding protein
MLLKLNLVEGTVIKTNMEEKMKKALTIIVAAALLCAVMALTGCSKKESGGGTTAAAGLVIGFSPGASGTNFRTEGTDAFREQCEEYKRQGRIKDYRITENVTNFDAAEQANIIRNFINDPAVNVIVVNPNSPTDLNGVLSEAVGAKKTVIVVDCEVNVPGVTCVSINHYDWSKETAEYICNALQSGNAIQIYGGEGHPANNQRINAVHDTLRSYPNIRLVSDVTGGWDEQVAKQTATQILGGGQQIDGVFTQDSMADGVLSAFLDLGKLPKVMYGECGTAFARKWKTLVDTKAPIQICSNPNPPTIVVSGLRIAVNVAEGKSFKSGVLGGQFGATYYYDVKQFYTNENFTELWNIVQNRSEDYLLTEDISVAEADALFL